MTDTAFNVELMVEAFKRRITAHVSLLDQVDWLGYIPSLPECNFSINIDDSDVAEVYLDLPISHLGQVVYKFLPDWDMEIVDGTIVNFFREIDGDFKCCKVIFGWDKEYKHVTANTNGGTVITEARWQ